MTVASSLLRMQGNPLILRKKNVGRDKGRADLDRDYQSFRIDGEAGKFSAGETLDRLLTQYPNAEVMINPVEGGKE